MKTRLTADVETSAPAATKDVVGITIAVGALLGIALHLVLRFGPFAGTQRYARLALEDWPTVAVLAFGGVPLVAGLLRKLRHGEFGADLLAGISIVASAILGEYLAGAIVVLMLSGGEALEHYAVRSASSVLQALSKRMPAVAHRRVDGGTADIALSDIEVGQDLVIHPHEACPVDGTVVEGHGTMDESYLTGEPYLMSKAPGSSVISGAINGESVLVIRADRRAVDSRYARIMQVMRDSDQHRPRLRRLGDQLGAIYTPIAVAIALAAWLLSGDAHRFLGVLVVATPCPLLIGIPVAIIGAVSLAARRAIIIKDPAVLEKLDTCQVAIFDKTGTLTYGTPKLTEIIPASGKSELEVLRLAASLERYSKHPLAGAILEAATSRAAGISEARQISEPPGAGLRGLVDRYEVRITGRRQFLEDYPECAEQLPPQAAGMECVVLTDGEYAATLRFRDEPRLEGRSFVSHLSPRHRIKRVLIVSGDRESEVRYLAERVGITEVFAGQSPEQKLELVRKETELAPTLFVGDGINDAPALTAATVGLAFGRGSDVTSEAAGAVVLDSSLEKVDELLHIGRRMRRIALESAVGGMALSVIGMGFAAVGWLPPVAGAVAQEAIDVLAVVNALRVACTPRALSDYR